VLAVFVFVVYFWIRWRRKRVVRNGRVEEEGVELDYANEAVGLEEDGEHGDMPPAYRVPKPGDACGRWLDFDCECGDGGRAGYIGSKGEIRCFGRGNKWRIMQPQ
jgi:hypothetical protein